ncbi:MAG TPA: formate/nitrite family transporter [Burkholderiaceae bacterium]|jgi:formate transporter|nr:formate/nitrite family transporter [Burkholderiaceae bacterium]
MTPRGSSDIRIDALLPAEMAAKAELTGVTKAGTDNLSLLLLALLAGAFIALGGLFYTVTIAGASATLPYGVVRLLGGVVFSLGLVLAICAGAELFTSDNLIVMAWASGKVSTASMLRTWVIVYVGNFVGAGATAVFVYVSGQYTFGNGAVGATALSVATGKLGYTFVQDVCLGILCNVLVCLAVWLTYSARTSGDKVIVLMLPISAFVAAGFEHCVANMYFFPHALLIKWGAPDSFWQAIAKTPADYPTLTWEAFLTGNLVAVTLGNVVGGTVLVGAVYWFVYLRRGARAVPARAEPDER